MNIKALEKKKDRFVIEVRGEDHTLLNLLREKSWKAGAQQANYMIEHPYLAVPKIIIKASDPKKVLRGAAELVVSEAKEFGKQFGRAMRR